MTLRFFVLAFLIAIIRLPEDARAESFPDDSGVINVRTFGALGNGSNDDTAAILRAIAASSEGNGDRSFWHDRIVYLPRGTYLVSGTLLKWDPLESTCRHASLSIL